MTPILELHNLTKVYDHFPALSNINLMLPRGRIIGLLGPNGSGKSTLIKLINGLLTPTSGHLLIGGMAPGVETKKIVSYLPERTYFNNWTKVRYVIDFFSDFYADFDRNKAFHMLNDLKIDPKATLRTLSKGTKEKVQLILVMSRRAQLYCLDEPIGGVDPASRDYILKTIITNYNEEATILLSTHLIADIENILDEIIFLQYGQIALYNSVENVRQQQGKSVDALFREVFRC